MHSCLLNYH